MRARCVVVGILGCCAVACGDDDAMAAPPAALCDAPAITSALASAASGAEVTLGSCEISGGFSVPAGVTLAGAGVGVTTLRGDGVAPVIELAPGSAVRGMSIAVPGGIGIRARGEGVLDVRDVAIDVERGIAVALRDATRVAITGTRITGPVTSANAASIGSPGDAADTGTFGILAFDVGGASDDDGIHLGAVEIRGFATAGIALVGSKLVWVGDGAEGQGVLEGNRGSGLLAFGGRVELRGVRACGTLSAPGLPGLTIAASEGAALVTDATTVCDGDGVGVFQDAAMGMHTGLEVRGLGQPAVWAQSGGSITVGEGSALEDDAVAGVVAVDVDQVTIEGARIEAIREGPIPDGGAGTERMGDGVHVTRSRPDAPEVSLAMSRVSLIDNARVGVLVDGLDAPATLALTDVDVSGSGEELGAIAQRVAELPDGWDADVTRGGATIANDEAFEMLRDVLETSGIIMPPAAPPALD